MNKENSQTEEPMKREETKQKKRGANGSYVF